MARMRTVIGAVAVAVMLPLACGSSDSAAPHEIASDAGGGLIVDY